MNANIILATQENFKFIRVVFAGASKQYTYKTNLSFTGEGDEYAIVQTASGLQVVEVVEVVDAMELDLEAHGGYKWVVSKVDMENYLNCIKVEREVMREVNKAKAKAASQEVMKQLEESVGSDAVKKIQGLIRL